MFQTKDFGKAASIILNSDYFTLIPFIGWLKAILLCAVTGINFSFYLNVVLVIMSTILMVIAVYKMKRITMKMFLQLPRKLKKC
jgi:presenilin-like A22 family membrane protease